MTTGISWDASELNRLAAELGTAAVRSGPAVVAAVKAGGKLIETTWRANAVATAGAHGKHYPRSIKSNMSGTNAASVQVTIAPDPGMMQGGMSFEFGSSRQPPHLDGARALETATPAVLSLVEKAVTEGVP